MASGDRHSEIVKDGTFFLNMGLDQQKRLLAMADEADKSLRELSSQSGIHEDVRGILRAAAGKARLLANKRLQQFLGLCEKNIHPEPNEQFKTTVEDLTGFFDMVNIEIVDVNNAFAQIDEVKKNGWRLPQSPPRAPKPTAARGGRSSGGRSKMAKKSGKPDEKKN